MPDRIVRAGILTSESVNRVSWPAEVFYRRLMSVVDDFGRYDGRASILRAALYPLKLNNVSEPDVAKWLDECSTAALVRSYTVEHKQYIEILKFDQRLRALKSKWPEPIGCQMPANDSGCGPPSDSASDSVSDSVSGLGVRGKGFPVTIDDAIQQCALVPVPKEFVMQCFSKADSRGGLDAKGIAIARFSSYVMIEWKYEQDRKGREKLDRPTIKAPKIVEASKLLNHAPTDSTVSDATKAGWEQMKESLK